MSNTTKRMLALSLKRLLSRRTLDDITIQDLVDDAEVSRKTFYYHFRDVYDLLEWVFLDEGKRILAGHTTSDTWQQGLRSVFEYLQENRAVILNLCRSMEKERGLLEDHLSELIQPLLLEIFEAQPEHERVSEEDRQFILDLYSFSLLRIFLRWIEKGMKPEAERLMDQIERIFSGSMRSVIHRCLGE